MSIVPSSGISYMETVCNITNQVQSNFQNYQRLGFFTKEREAMHYSLRADLRELGSLLKFQGTGMIKASSNPEDMRGFIGHYYTIFQKMQNFMHAEFVRQNTMQNCINKVTVGLFILQNTVNSMQDCFLKKSFIQDLGNRIHEYYQELNVYKHEIICVSEPFKRAEELWGLLNEKDRERQEFLQTVSQDLDSIKGVMDTMDCIDLPEVLQRLMGYQTVLEQQLSGEVEDLMESIRGVGQHLQAKLSQFEELIGSIKMELESIYAVAESGGIRRSTAAKHKETLARMEDSLREYSERDVSNLMEEINQLYIVIKANIMNIQKSHHDDDHDLSDGNQSGKRSRLD